MSLFLNNKEICELTRRRRRDAQVRVLRKMGIEFKLRGDGSPVVLESHIQKVFDGMPDAGGYKGVEPNWDGMPNG